MHLSEEQLVFLYYGEGEGRGHLEQCPECRVRFEALERTLASVSVEAPERGPFYEAQLWARIQPSLAPQGRWWRFWVAPPRWVTAAAMACLLVGAFAAGWLLRPDNRRPAPIAYSSDTANRVLAMAVGQHLDRSQLMLTELANSGEDSAADTSIAEDLLESNRLYRQTAEREGQAAVAALLDDLERVLLEIAHEPQGVSSERLDDLRFEMRVIRSKLKARKATVTTTTKVGEEKL
ncbi:MAG: hypothetical protein SFV54_01320 [Bryobacteraceae bacterium]|nr:hypothetical protein [Bryobacteraceae bacterium]